MAELKAYISQALEARRKQLKVSKRQISRETGLVMFTVRGVFDGTSDYHISALIAIMDYLGLDMVIARASNANIEDNSCKSEE